jgi:hypothetical protein
LDSATNSPPDLVITTADGTHLAESENLLDPTSVTANGEAEDGSNGGKHLYTVSVHATAPSDCRRPSFAANMLNFAGEVAKKKPKLDEETKQVFMPLESSRYLTLHLCI